MKKKIIEKLHQLLKKSKFDEDSSILYPGIGKTEIKEEITGVVNNVIVRFINSVDIAGTDEEYRKIIFETLPNFDKFELDTEDRERVCHYFEEIMDIIELESSDGILNNWLYGFEN